MEEVDSFLQQLMNVLLYDVSKNLGTNIERHYTHATQQRVSDHMNKKLQEFLRYSGIYRPVAAVSVYVDEELEMPTVDLMAIIENKEHFCSEWLDKGTLEKALVTKNAR